METKVTYHMGWRDKNCVWQQIEGHEQNDSELAWLCTRLLRLECKSILEIGSRNGKTLQAFARACPLAKLYSIDPVRPAGWKTTVDELEAENRSVRQFDSPSQQPRVVEWAAKLAPFDFIFIDGDHSLPGVAQDWYNYSSLGTLIGLHDIDGQNEGVRRLWQDLCLIYEFEEKIAIPSSMGIGLIWPKNRRVLLCPQCGRNSLSFPHTWERIRCAHCHEPNSAA